jgi:hypothetical protein
MKLRYLLTIPFLSLSSLAQDAPPARQMIVAAIGEIPVPRMKVTEDDGFIGYVHDETSTNKWFPQEWTVAGKPIKLALNIEPVAVKMPVGKEPFNLAPGGATPKPQTLPEIVEEEVTMMVLFNREAEKTWKEGFDSQFVSCRKLNTAAPTAVVLNLSGAVVSVTALDRTIQQIGAGKSAVAAMLVNPQSGLKLLPLSAAAGGKTYPLDVVPLDIREPWCPVVVIYPSTGPSKKARPLHVTVIQPSNAVPAEQSKVPPAK